MTRMENIQDFLAQKRFAFAGVSRQPKDFSRALFREFRKRGYEPVPVHLEVTELEGARAFTHLRDIQPPVDSVLLMTSPAVTDLLVRECMELGIKRIWFYRGGGQGSLTDGALQMCKANGIIAIEGECPFMFFDGTPWFHRFHGLVKKIMGAYPR
ncbi:MAG: CoA-binding protein [Candidatus Solibacter sp.]|nr:CoA-binding protein [Candidatus Solibacter sp.]